MKLVRAVQVWPSFAMVTVIGTARPAVALPMDREQLATPLGAAVASHPLVTLANIHAEVMLAPPGLPLVQLRTAVSVMFVFRAGVGLLTEAVALQTRPGTGVAVAAGAGGVVRVAVGGTAVGGAEVEVGGMAVAVAAAAAVLVAVAGALVEVTAVAGEELDRAAVVGEGLALVSPTIEAGFDSFEHASVKTPAKTTAPVARATRRARRWARQGRPSRPHEGGPAMAQLLTLETDETGEARIAEQELPGAFAVVDGRFRPVAGAPMGDRSVLVTAKAAAGAAPKYAPAPLTDWFAWIAKGPGDGARRGTDALAGAGLRPQGPGAHLPSRRAAKALGELLDAPARG